MLLKTLLLRILFACLLAVAAMPVVAQEPEPSQEEVIRKVIPIRYIAAEAIRAIVYNFVDAVTANRDLGVVAIVGSAQQVEAAENAIRQLDVPERAPSETERAKKNVELTVYFLGAMDGAGEDLSETAMGPVVAQLREQFPYPGYRLLETFLVRAREGTETLNNGVFEADIGGNEEMLRYEFSALIQGLRGDPSVIGIGALQCEWRAPIRGDTGKIVSVEELHVRSDIDVPENKLVVVGKAGAPGPTRGIFVVIRARVAE